MAERGATLVATAAMFVVARTRITAAFSLHEISLEIMASALDRSGGNLKEDTDVNDLYQ